ncbi:ABC transporter permease protein [Pseudovibrio sp. FO-BEG1]|uniref:ABC-type spermidine/putrescine transport system, permease component II n=1 Tax=Pseudovibrio denitrificans TaxID=258256 RepID=A0A1I6Z6H6_9HYPH|nr:MULTISPECIES: ABC transporter permease subunit [Pseudovibrio]AEV39005.1 ABC transporter permease protein [Pseudovibrio sp. FO-BEG1]SFT58294.1 ABC-type spermidine/putrescine transport system, permease component II [Pseudovibrio denitrificans]
MVQATLSSNWVRMTTRVLTMSLLAFAIFGPITNMLLWAVAEVWYFPYKLPLEYGFSFWERVFRPEGNATEALFSSIWIALLTVVVSLAIAIPAGYALARGKMPFRYLIMLLFLLPQAFPAVAVHMNVARIFYGLDLTGTVMGVVLVHASQGLVFAVWIATAAFAAVDGELEAAARNMGAGRWRTFIDVTLPLALPGIMASAIFVFLISMDEFTGTYFVGAPDVVTLPMLLFTSSMEGNYQIASISSLILLVPSVGFMLFIERFLKADVLAKVGS